MTGKTQSIPLSHKRQGGFTLILSLFLLAILAALGVAFGLLVVLETKASYHKRHVIRARENAKTALNQALQKIQEEAGPDQRVTARAEIWADGAADPDPQPATSSHAGKIQGKNIGRQYYTGVWNSARANSTPSWLVSTQPKSGGDKDHFTHPSYLHRSNYPLSTDLESDPDFVRLVRGTGRPLLNKYNKPLDSKSVDDSIWLWKSAVQEGQRGNDPDEYRSMGHYAWWVGDESLKARVNLGLGDIDKWKDKAASTSIYDFKHVTPFTVANKFGFEGFGNDPLNTSDNGLGDFYQKIAKLPPHERVEAEKQLEASLSLQSLIPLELATEKQVRRIFHDATSSSRGVLADARNGGLKRDLTSALQKDKNLSPDDIEFDKFLFGRTNFRKATGSTNIIRAPHLIFDPLTGLARDFHKPPNDLKWQSKSLGGEDPGGPAWLQLRSYARLYEAVNANGTAFDTSDDYVPIRTHSDVQHGIAPVLTRFQAFFTATLMDTGKTMTAKVPDGNGNNQTKSLKLYKVAFHVLPAVVLWNPYDIRIEKNDYTVLFWRNSFPGNTGGYKNQCFPDSIQVRSGGTNLTVHPPIRFKHKMTFKIKNEIFEPGQAKVFFPMHHSPYNPYNGQNQLVSSIPQGGSFYTFNYTTRPKNGDRPHTNLDWPMNNDLNRDPSLVDLAGLTNRGNGIYTDDKYLEMYVREDKAFNSDFKFRYTYGSTRRGGMVLYSYDIPEDKILPIGRTSSLQNPSIDTGSLRDKYGDPIFPIQYMKKLRTRGPSPGHTAPPVFNPRSTFPLVYSPGGAPESANGVTLDWGRLLSGKKYFMRFVENESKGDYYPKVGLKKVRWLGDLNPRSNTFGRSPNEWNLSTQDTTVSLFKTGVISTGDQTYEVKIRDISLWNPEESGFIRVKSPYLGFSEVGGQVNRCVLFEIPRNENFLSSIGQLMHCNFTADYGNKTTKWYFETGEGMREYFSDNIGPAYALGNSLCPVWLTNARSSMQRFELERDVSARYSGYLYDKSYLLNDALWDHYFFSGISRINPMGHFEDRDTGEEAPYDRANPGGVRHVPGAYNPRIGYFWGKGGMPLPDSEGWDTKGLDIKKHDQASAHLAIEGPFNVNSTSVDAWRAFLSSFWYEPHEMAEIFLKPNDPGVPFIGGDSGSVFLRTHGVFSQHFRGKRESDGFGVEDSYSLSAYVGYRQIHQAEIDALAKRIVELVKERGPFRSMAQFVNRNLKSGTSPSWLYKGTLQEAIDSAQVYDDIDGDGQPDPGSSPYIINQRFLDKSNEELDFGNGGGSYNTTMLSGNYYNSVKPRVLKETHKTNRAIATGVPGYLSQADILARLGHAMTVRSDTFVVRAYGDSVDPLSSRVRRTEVCEAVVQRFPDYVHESMNNPQDTDRYAPYQFGGMTNKKLLKSNVNLGRKFRVISFRWLPVEEI